jgi:hypothetical protein
VRGAPCAAASYKLAEALLDDAQQLWNRRGGDAPTTGWSCATANTARADIANPYALTATDLRAVTEALDGATAQ